MSASSDKQLITPAAFAKLLGVEQSSVSRAISSGRMKDSLHAQPNGKFLIDEELGRQEFEENKRRGSTQKRDREKMDEEGTDNASIAVHEKTLKRYQAEMARLKFEEMAGRLIDSTRAKQELFKIARSVRDAMMSIPDRLSAQLAATTETFEVSQLLTKEIRSALENLKTEIVADAENTALDEDVESDSNLEDLCD